MAKIVKVSPALRLECGSSHYSASEMDGRHGMWVLLVRMGRVMHHLVSSVFSLCMPASRVIKKNETLHSQALWNGYYSWCRVCTVRIRSEVNAA